MSTTKYNQQLLDIPDLYDRNLLIEGKTIDQQKDWTKDQTGKEGLGTFSD